jgi:hypothetical protein
MEVEEGLSTGTETEIKMRGRGMRRFWEIAMRVLETPKSKLGW